MSRLWILLVISGLAEAYQPALLIANKTGVYYQNLTTGITKPVMEFSHGATYVDYNGDKEIYAILSSTKSESHKIIRVQFPKYSTTRERCIPSPKSLPPWCYYDLICGGFCQNSEFENFTQLLQPTNCMYASNLVVDWKNNNLYWSCQVPSKSPAHFAINRANTDGKMEKQLKEISNGKIWDIKIDPYVSKLFWLLESFSKRTITVKTSNLDAANDQDIYSFETSHDKLAPKITLDIHNQKLYLVKGGKSLLCMNYNGTDVKPLDPNILGDPFDSQLSNVTQSKLYHPLLQTRDLKCPEHGCPHVCSLLTWRGVECSNSTAIEGYITNNQTTAGSSKAQSDDFKPENESNVRIGGTFDVNQTAYSGDDKLDVTSAEKKDDKVDGTSAEAVSSSGAASSSSRLAMFLLVFTTIWSAVFLVGLVIKSKINQGIYWPGSANENVQVSQVST